MAASRFKVKDWTAYPDGSGAVGLFECEGAWWRGAWTHPRKGAEAGPVSKSASFLKRGIQTACLRRVEAFVRGRVEELGPAWLEANRRMYEDEG